MISMTRGALRLTSMLVVVAFGAATNAVAVEPPKIIQDGMIETGICQGQAVAKELASNKTAERIADEAVAACMPQQAELLRNASKLLGSSGLADVRAALENNRRSLLRVIEEKRRGGPVSNPATAWGECLARHVREHASDSDSSASAVKSAFGACRSAEAVLRGALPNETVANLKESAERRLLRLADQFRSGGRE